MARKFESQISEGVLAFVPLDNHQIVMYQHVFFHEKLMCLS